MKSLKPALIAILLIAITVNCQQRNPSVERTLPPGQPGTVTLSLAEYNHLMELAAKKPKPPETAPLPFILSRAAFKLRVGDESVLGTVDIDGDVLRKGQTKVPLITGLTVLEAQQQQKPLPLLQDGSNHAAVLGGPGSFSISMSVALSITAEPGRAFFTLPVPAAGSTLLNLDLTGNHANVRIEPGIVTSRSTSNGHTIIEATLEPGRLTRIWWTTREVAAPVTQREVRFLSDLKTLISVGDSEARVTSLCDITVVQGDAAELKVPLPQGYELTEATGSTLDSSDVQNGVLTLKFREPARRSHQFLIVLERPSQGNMLNAPLLSVTGTQRETGEVLVEGVGTMELTATEGGSLKRIDVREANPIARSLARYPLQAAFRYHRRPGESPTLALAWNQFQESQVLSAIAERATITTLMNVEGKSLTEVTLKVRNHAQPFMKIELPKGSALVSAEVEGEKVKPAQDADGNRVPLLRAGFRPPGVYTVSFVYFSTGTPFAKTGAYNLSIPKLDVPVSLLTWEVFLPDRIQVSKVEGNALAADLLPAKIQDDLLSLNNEIGDEQPTVWVQTAADLSSLEAGQIGGIVVDRNGAVVTNARVTVTSSQTGATQVVSSDAEGRWVASGVASGPLRVKVDASGFKSFEQELNFSSSRAAPLGITLDVGGATEMVTVSSGQRELEREGRRIEQQMRKDLQARQNAPSVNVTNLQKRVAGILPVQVDVPRAGKSYRFVRPLVLEEETRVSFQYKTVK
ncbi:MAG TPA: carboxypeptidase-like regulatory domain-containing protein [Blastocatellia bacterium]|nr:carboxypeptidase-like regulatory domain-containing protein [Blastocatellia bacterium]